jgi:hypothetical protein
MTWSFPFGYWLRLIAQPCEAALAAKPVWLARVYTGAKRMERAALAGVEDRSCGKLHGKG